MVKLLVPGKRVVDSNGKVLIEIINSDIRPAVRIVKTASGDVFLRSDPYYKDAYLTLKFSVIEMNGNY